MTTSRIKNVLVCVLALAAFAGFADTDINITSDTTLYASDINADANYKVKAGVTLTIDIDSNVSCRCLRNDSDVNPGGKVVKKGPGTLTLTKKSSNNLVAYYINVEIEEGSIFLSANGDHTESGRPAIHNATFVLGANSADVPLDNDYHPNFSGPVTISNETAKSVFSYRENGLGTDGTNRGRIYGSGKLTKGGAGTLTFLSKFSVNANAIQVQDGTLLLYVKNSDEAYTYTGDFSGNGRFGKTGAGTLTVSNVVEQTYAGGIEVVEGEMKLRSDCAKTVAGVYGNGTLVNASTSTLYLVCNRASGSVYSNTYAVDGGTVKTTSGDISLGKDPDRGLARNATFVLAGGTLTGYNWPRFYGTNVFDVTTPATIYKNTDQSLRFCGNEEVGCTIVKKGAATLTFDIDIGEPGYPGKTALVIEEGRVCYRERESFKHAIRCNSITGAGDFYVSGFPVGIKCSGLHISNLTLSDNASFEGDYKNDITITGRLQPRRALSDLSQTFTFADGATIDVSALGGTFGGTGVLFNSETAGARVTVDVGDRDDFKSGDYLCRLGARPTMNLAFSGTKVATWKAVGVADGIKVIAPGLMIIFR